MRLIVGLGNPDVKYKLTRHNFGFLVVGALADESKVELKKSSGIEALGCKFKMDGQDCMLSLPLTYMNRSGQAVSAQVAKMALSPRDILIICDDMALPFGQMRIRPHGSHGGHNGLRSISDQLGHKDFARLRLGVGRPPTGMDPADYVLSKFTPAETKALLEPPAKPAATGICLSM